MNNTEALLKISKGNKEPLIKPSAEKSPAQGPMMDIEFAREAPTQNIFNSLYMPCFLLNPPFYVDNKQPNNAFVTGKNAEPIDHKKAMAQFMDLYTVMAAGSLVYMLPAQNDLQDQVYTANLGMVLPTTIKDAHFLLSNYRSDPRKHEEDAGREFFSSMEFDISQPKGLFWEGEADLKYIRDNIFVGGYGIRSDIYAYNWMEDNYDMKIVKVKMTDEKLYHFDCMYFPLNNDNSLVCTAVMESHEIKAVEAVTNIIDCPLWLAHEGSTNCVRVGTQILNASAIESMDKKSADYMKESKRVNWLTNVCGKLGLDTVFINLSEFEKSGAALSCQVLHLNYFDYQRQGNKEKK